MKIQDIDDFTRHYIAAALWTEFDDDGTHLDEHYGIEDLAPAALQQAIDDCANFQRHAAPELHKAYDFYTKIGAAAHPDAGSPEACAGHDFWLTRGGHGTGFWDRGMDNLGDVLTSVAKSFREASLYVGDDGKLYFE